MANKDIVYFMLVFWFDKGYGNNREISMSKIKKRIIIKKNCIENGLCGGFWGVKPHSKALHFWKSGSVIKEVNFTSNVMIMIKTVVVRPNIIVVIFYEPHQYKFKYKNSQTTSTKCQYQAAHSNAVMWFILLFILCKRFIATIRNVVPIMTCSPWNPVAMKNVDPNTESAMENGASIYSKPCNNENSSPSVTVITKDFNLRLLLFFRIAWWHHVMETPEDKSNRVLSNGILTGLKGIILCGGHAWPKSILGEILLWKKAQKKDVKKNTSEIINNSMPACNPTVTCFLWFPCLVDSEKTSRHQLNAVMRINVKDNVKQQIILALIQMIIEIIRVKAPNEASKGQGLFSTIWYGWNFFVILIFSSVQCN